MTVELLPVNPIPLEERRRFVDFVNLYYPAEISLEEEAVASGRSVFFWVKIPGEKEPVGTTGFIPKTRFLAETVKTVVRDDQRGKGLGAAISLAIEEEVRRRGFKKIMSTIYITNLPMIFIKLKQGYRFEGFHPDHEKPGLHEYSLGKVLA